MSSREAGEKAASQGAAADASGARGCARRSHQRGDAIRLAALALLSFPRWKARSRRARKRLPIRTRRSELHSPTCSSPGSLILVLKHRCTVFDRVACRHRT
jgi:hypothetical protein